MKKILITGGHVTPALATIELLCRNKWEVVYVGRKYALEGDTAYSQEHRIITALGIPFRTLTTGRLQRSLTVKGIKSLFKIPLGLWQAWHIVGTEKPQVILSFGGYVAVPVVIAGWLMRIPVVTHEQTLSPGLANRIIAKFATKICISWPETQTQFPAHKTVLTGNPVRKEVLQPGKALDIEFKKPLVYITGGNLGSHSINLVVEDILPQLLNDYSVIHQCGNAAEFNDLKRLEKLRAQLPAPLKKRYLVTEYVDSEHIGWVLHSADVVVSRAGANSMLELLLLTKPAVFIPLPWSGAGEQEKNAHYLASRDAALLLSQKELTGSTFLHAIKRAYEQRAAFKKNLQKLQMQIPARAAEELVEVVESIA